MSDMSGSGSKVGRPDAQRASIVAADRSTLPRGKARVLVGGGAIVRDTIYRRAVRVSERLGRLSSRGVGRWRERSEAWEDAGRRATRGGRRPGSERKRSGVNEADQGTRSQSQFLGGSWRVRQGELGLGAEAQARTQEHRRRSAEVRESRRLGSASVAVGANAPL
jgi:hypothetical protein